jgi:serine/threonine-protein kinase RsbW
VTTPDRFTNIRKKSFPATFACLKEVGEFVKLAAQEAGFGQSDTYAIQLAVDEACSNIIEHAYHNTDNGSIECTCTVTERGLDILVHDYGDPFNPAAVPQPSIDTELERRERGGLGLYFMRQLMDDVVFRFEPPRPGKPKKNTGNFLLMKKLKDAGV